MIPRPHISQPYYKVLVGFIILSIYMMPCIWYTFIVIIVFFGVIFRFGSGESRSLLSSKKLIVFDEDNKPSIHSGPWDAYLMYACIQYSRRHIA
jgi:hypothetical protein